MTLTNVAVSGRAMLNFHDLIAGYAEDYDLITVLLGTNNQGYNSAIGELNDSFYTKGEYTSNSSFIAQTQRLIDLLLEKYPDKVIAFLTPIRRTSTSDANSNNDEGYQVNALGLTTEPYVEAVKKVCDYYGIPCLDLYHYGINPKELWMRQKYFLNENGTDGTHPNNLGHSKYIAPKVTAFLKEIAPFDVSEE